MPAAVLWIPYSTAGHCVRLTIITCICHSTAHREIPLHSHRPTNAQGRQHDEFIAGKVDGQGEQSIVEAETRSGAAGKETAHHLWPPGTTTIQHPHRPLHFCYLGCAPDCHYGLLLNVSTPAQSSVYSSQQPTAMNAGSLFDQQHKPLPYDSNAYLEHIAIADEVVDGRRVRAVARRCR
ncbi:hypothetical protein EJ03DRAFT_163076 [Teratosphaeria nubilosa]|uniref:Uncharacterized protein n=1 Tax=Teratosphaeria nubilosa TaxID=161662 RepID=A0A6G1L2B8_9PEZI|nr:hypothetical protein EJ03DRAFT_163076 [Teratosphaeria nubilosa]